MRLRDESGGFYDSAAGCAEAAEMFELVEAALDAVVLFVESRS